MTTPSNPVAVIYEKAKRTRDEAEATSDAAQRAMDGMWHAYVETSQANEAAWVAYVDALVVRQKARAEEKAWAVYVDALEEQQ